MDNSDKTFDRNQYMPPAEPVSQSAVAATIPAAAPSTGPTEPPSNPPGKKIPASIIAGAIVLLIIIGVIVMLATRQPSDTTSANQNQVQPTGQGEQRVIPTIDNTRPALAFASAETTTQYKVGDEVTFVINAHSQGADVYGYDLLFPYDKEAVEILETKSATENFQIFAHDRGDYYAVTGIKQLSVTTPTIFDNAPILEMKVKLNKAGTYYLELLPERGKETSKLVDKDSKIIQPQIQPIKLEIQ